MAKPLLKQCRCECQCMAAALAKLKQCYGLYESLQHCYTNAYNKKCGVWVCDVWCCASMLWCERVCVCGLHTLALFFRMCRDALLAHICYVCEHATLVIDNKCNTVCSFGHVMCIIWCTMHRCTSI